MWRILSIFDCIIFLPTFSVIFVSNYSDKCQIELIKITTNVYRKPFYIISVIITSETRAEIISIT